MKNQIENPKGLHARYHIQKIVKVLNPNFSPTAKVSQVADNSEQYVMALAPIDKNAEYFVLRLDTGGKDIQHIKACRIAINSYALAMQDYLPQLSAELIEKYPLL